MATYLARRTGLGLLTLWLVSVAGFALIRVAPGDPVTAALALAPGEGGLSSDQLDERRRELGLDRNWFIQYADWIGDAIRLDPGVSLSTGQPVTEDLSARVAVTFELAFISLLLIALLGVGGGFLAARHRGRPIDLTLRSLAFGGLSAPTFWIGLILIVAVATWTDTFLAARFEPFSESPTENLASIAPASAVLALRPASLLLRVVRASTLEAMSVQYFLLARAKGVSLETATLRHALRSAALPSVTFVGAQAVFLLGGSIVIEQVFGLPGLGRGLVAATQERDYPTVQAIVMLFAVIAVSVNLLTDLVYVRLDPRVKAAS